MQISDISSRYSPHGNGYIKVYRKLLSSAVFQNEKLLKVWIWCLIRANWHEATCFFEGKEIPLEPGQFITGRFTGSEECGMNAGTFYKCIKKLEEIGNISIKSDNRKSILTIVNYSTYQGDLLEEWQQSNNKVTTKGQPSNTDKEYKNKKSKEIKIYAVDSNEYGLSQFLFTLIRINDPKAKYPDLQKWAKEIDSLMRIDSRSYDEINEVIKFSQTDSFWKTNILSTKKLRYQFPKLLLQMKERKNGTGSKPSSATSRATFRHGDVEKQHLRELQATLEERDRERNLRSAADSK